MASIAMAAVLIGGCGKPVLRLADASLGDYYTEEEFKKLRQDQREEYCRELAEQDSIYREEIAAAGAEAEGSARRALEARAARDSLAALADSLETRIALVHAGGRAGGTDGAAVESAVVTVVTVRRGDSLWRLSARRDIYGDGREWPRLYEANRDRIRDADRIDPGQELRVPR